MPTNRKIARPEEPKNPKVGTFWSTPEPWRVYVRGVEGWIDITDMKDGESIPLGDGSTYHACRCFADDVEAMDAY